MPVVWDSFQGGRCKVIKKLGEGGKGIVFLCQDTLLGRPVAIKLIKEEVLDPEGLLRFQREAQAMARLVHPHVVTVFDLGQEEGRHFLVLELMEGGDVEHLIASSPHKRLDPAIAVGIGRDVARALEYAHRHGILHRDVKPGNIWLTGEGQAKLGDFGLAYLGGGTRVTQAGMLVGTVAYMAPEVALGRPADARSDLYMLGASLYEMVTGRVPFPGEDPVRVLFSHINDLPLPPRRFAPEIPEGLEALILRLLSKDPEGRPASATEVLRLLEEVERTLQAAPVTPGVAGGPPAPPGSPPTPEPRFAQPLVGREREVAFLRGRVDAALRGEGSLVFLTGEAGIGKTRLALEVRPYARGRGFLWLEGHYPREGSLPAQPWVEAVRAFLTTAPPNLAMKVLLPYGAELARWVPEVAERLGRVPPPPPTSPEEERTRLFAALAGFFTGIAREQPLTLFLDDLHWAPSLDTLLPVARQIAPERLLVLAAYREAELKEKPALSRALLDLNRERLFHPLPLKRLGQDEVARLLAHALGEGASARLAETLYQKTEGNPFFLEEVVRYLTESGAITLGEKGWEVRDQAVVLLPDSVKAVVGERLERLGEEARGVLAWASVVGKEFSLPLLQQVAGLEEEKLLEVVDKAVVARVLTPRPSLGQEVYAFADQQVRDVLYEGIGPARRRRYHLKVGQAVEKVHPRRPEEHYEALARHFLEGNDLSRATEYAIKAGERASAAFAWPRALTHYETALELLEELPEDLARQAGVLERLGDLDLFLGRPGLRHFQGALELYTRLGEKRKAARIHRLVAAPWASGQAGYVDLDKALAHYQAGVKLLETEPDSPEKALTYSGLAFGFARMLDLELALEPGRRSLQIAERLKDPDQVARACVELACILASQGELAQAEEYAEQSWEAVLQGNDPEAKARASHYPILVWPWRHDRAWLERWMERCLEFRRRTQFERSDRARWGLSALLLALTGMPREAIEALRHADEAASRHPYLHPYLVHFAGAAHALLGEWERAHHLLSGSLETGEKGRFRSAFVDSSVEYGRFLLASGDTARAEEVLMKCYGMAHEKGSILHEVNLLPLLCELHVWTGRLELAERDLKRAQELLSRPQPWRGLAAPVYLAQGLLATTRNNWPEAEQAFHQALDTERAYGFPYNEARILFEWGQMSLARNTPGDRERGVGLLDQALTIFQRCAAKKDVEKVLARKQVLQA